MTTKFGTKLMLIAFLAMCVGAPKFIVWLGHFQRMNQILILVAYGLAAFFLILGATYNEERQ